MNIFCLSFFFQEFIVILCQFPFPSRKYIVSPCSINILQARSSPEILPPGVTDENEVVTAVANENMCPEFNSDRHSKEVKTILCLNVLITGFLK